MLLMVAGRLPAQVQVAGRVWMEGVPVAGATVQLAKQTLSTDSIGSFRFENLPEGRQVLHVSFVGAEHFQLPVFLGKGKTDTLEIRLQPVISSLDAVVVSGTMKPVSKLESPIPVEVFTPQFFRKNPAPSIFESMQNVNGVRPQINCSVCNTGDIHINGLEGPYTMVTIDGMPIVSSLATVYGLFAIPTEMIERVEVVKGPASGLYGSEAIGGLINVITKNPEKAPLFAANVMATNWREYTADLGMSWKMGRNLHAMTALNHFNYNDPRDYNKDGFTDVTLQTRTSIFSKWKLMRPGNRDASVGLRYFHENRWGGEVNWNPSYRGGDSIYGESIYTRRWEAIANYQLPSVPVRLAFSANGHQQDSYYGTTPYLADQKIVFGQLLWEPATGPSHTMLVGLAGRYNYYDDNSTATVDVVSGKNAPDRSFLPGLFVQSEWNAGGAHHLLAGLRVDHHPVHGMITTPRLAWKWRTGEGQTFRLNGGTGFRVVNLFTEDHAALTGARTVEIRQQLKPEQSYNVNLNFMQQFGTVSKQFNLDASAWYSYFTNQIIADYDTDPQKIIYDNLSGHSFSRGVSLNAEVNWKRKTKALLGVTVQDVRKVEDVNGKPSQVRPVLTEGWSGVWTISHNFTLAGITLDYTGNIYGPMRLPLVSELDPRSEYSPIWSIQNLQATKWINSSLELYGGIKNLLNWTPAKNNPFIIARSHDPFDKQVEYDVEGRVKATPENPYALTFDPSYVYAPNQGRRYYMGVRVKLR